LRAGHIKSIIVAGDGMADRPLRELNGKPPEAAEKPSLDWVAKNSVCGIIASDIPPGSDTASALFMHIR